MTETWVAAGRGSRGDSQMRIEYRYRFPVKGLMAEAMESTEVEAGGAIPWDRAFALAQGYPGKRHPEQSEGSPRSSTEP